MVEKLRKIPVPVLPTFVGTLTLGNVYGGLGYTWFRVMIMIIAAIIVVAYLLKMILCTSTCIEEYKQTVPSSLYAAFTMCIMILGSYLFEIGVSFGKWMWLCAIVIHAIHILIFTMNNIVLKRDINTTLPCWFVTYNGIMVGCVTGSAMNMIPLLKVITVYGIIIYIVLIPVIIFRLIKVPIKPAVYHTMPIVLAPCSLCVVSLINVYSEPNRLILYLMYACVIASLVFIIIKLPDFFSFDFAPGFAGMTFPMAIGIVATNKMAAYLSGHGIEQGAVVLTQLSGLQLFITSMLVGYVLLNFLRMLLGKTKRTS